MDGLLLFHGSRPGFFCINEINKSSLRISTSVCEFVSFIKLKIFRPSAILGNMEQQDLIKTYLSEIMGSCKPQFDLYENLLLNANQHINLTSITKHEDIVSKHFLDSLLAESFIPQGASVADVGSGGGCPAIPLKIVRDDLSFTLIEATGKKCLFLESVVDKMSLSGVEVLNMRAEDAGKSVKHREAYDVCCARAVAPLNILAEYCLPLVKTGGIFIAYKGDAAEETETARNAVSILGGSFEGIHPFTLPDAQGCRTVLVIRKVHSTPAKYPRANGKVKKNPLI
ncbi:MAG: 16S rRNA (guanine(527)-N(7))-methyltransferase RsmG [Clostridia bacterium]|nr:16S rRNA (guanine(527)-N(7))-methyltransferase RsmG [Clostridia bacterium]